MILGGIIPEIDGFEIFNYSHPIMSSGLSTLVYVVYDEGYIDFLTVFDEVVWVVLIFSTVLSGLAFWMYEKDCKTKYNIRMTTLESIMRALFNIFELIFSVIEKPIKTIPARILLTGFFLLMAVVSDYYVGYQVRKLENKISTVDKKVFCL